MKRDIGEWATLAWDGRQMAGPFPGVREERSNMGGTLDVDFMICRSMKDGEGSNEASQAEELAEGGGVCGGRTGAVEDATGK